MENTTPEEKFLSDLAGYLVVRGAFGRDQIDELDALADAFPASTTMASSEPARRPT